MSEQIPNHYKTTYESNIEVGLQQKQSKLEACVLTSSQDGQEKKYPDIGVAETTDVVSRLEDTPIQNQAHGLRTITMTPSVATETMDKWDDVKVITDPTSTYVTNMVSAHNRRKDRHIIEAAVGPAWAGEKGKTQILLPSAQIVPVDYVESGAAAASRLTIGKLRRAAEILGLADNDDDEPTYIALTQYQISDLLKTTEVTSDDFNTVKALVSGTVNSFMGFEFKRLSTKVMANLKTGTVRRVVAFKKSGVRLASKGKVETRITELPHKNFAKLIWTSTMQGASRMNEEKVVAIDCEEGV